MTDQPPPAVRPPPPRSVADDEISLWEVLAVILRRRGTIVGTTIVITALTILVLLLRPPTFTTSAMFRPQGSQASASQLTALASQFGVAVPGAGEEASPAFYAEIVTSREVLKHAATRTYDVDGVGSIQLKDLLEIEGDTEAQIRSVEEAVLSLGELQRGAVVVVTMGSPVSDPGTTNLLKVHRLGTAPFFEVH